MTKPHSPPSGTDPAPPQLIYWALGAVALASIGGGLAGLLIGSFLGWGLPNYYRSVFRNGDSPTFDPFSVGAGLGLSQGLLAGGAIGVVICGLYFWHRSRVYRRD